VYSSLTLHLVWVESVWDMQVIHSVPLGAILLFSDNNGSLLSDSRFCTVPSS